MLLRWTLKVFAVIFSSFGEIEMRYNRNILSVDCSAFPLRDMLAKPWMPANSKKTVASAPEIAGMPEGISNFLSNVHPPARPVVKFL